MRALSELCTLPSLTLPQYGLHKANITRTSLATHLTSAPNARASIAMDVPLDSIVANQSSLLEALSVENLAGVMTGEVSSVTAALRMRVGRQAYGSNLHFDPSHNWVLAVAGQKRAVLLHPFESECLHIDMNSTRGSYRQSALPVRAAQAWLDAHCTANQFAEPIAMQHRFQEGDLLFIPANCAQLTYLNAHALPTHPRGCTRANTHSHVPTSRPTCGLALL